MKAKWMKCIFPMLNDKRKYLHCSLQSNSIKICYFRAILHKTSLPDLLSHPESIANLTSFWTRYIWLFPTNGRYNHHHPLIAIFHNFVLPRSDKFNSLHWLIPLFYNNSKGSLETEAKKPYRDQHHIHTHAITRVLCAILRIYCKIYIYLETILSEFDEIL